MVFLLVENSFHPTDEEVLLAEDLVEQRLKIYNAEEEASNLDRRYFFGDSLHYQSDLIFFDKYYRQCEASINERGEKIIVFNCLCNIDDLSKKDWSKKKIIVADGGSCYFQIAVNLDKKIVFGFMINGSA